MLGSWLTHKHRAGSDLAGKGDDLCEPLLRQQDDDLLNRSPLASYTSKQPVPPSKHKPPKGTTSKATSSEPAFIFGVIPTLRTISVFNASVLALMAAAAGSVSSTGILLLFFLLMSRLHGPGCIEIVRPLAFEYNEHGATAIANLHPSSTHTPSWASSLRFGSSADYSRASSSAVTPVGAHGGSSGVRGSKGAAAAGSSGRKEASERVLQPGQRVSVGVTLHVPPQRSHTLFQVTGELLSDNQTPLARATRSWLSKPVSMITMRRLVFAWPLVLLGLGDDARRLDMVLLPEYIEKADEPLMAFRALLTGRTPAEGAPSVYGGELRIRLMLTWRQELLHMLAPSPLIATLLGALGFAMMVGGGTAFAITAAAAWFVYRWGRARGSGSRAVVTDGRGGRSLMGVDVPAMLGGQDEREWLVLAGKGKGGGYADGRSGYGDGRSGYGGSSSYSGEGGDSPVHKANSVGSFFMVPDGASAGGGSGGAGESVTGRSGTASAGGSPRYSQLLGQQAGAVSGGEASQRTAFVGGGGEWSSDYSESRHQSPSAS